MSRDNKTSLNSRHGAHNRTQQHERGLFMRLAIFMAWVVGIGLLLALVACQQTSAKPIASADTSSYYIDLSNLISDLPSRKILAFFMPDNSAAPQAVTIYSSIAPQAHSNATRGQTIISIANHLLTDYDGLTLQNKIVARRICGAVSNKTESKTRHPIPLTYSVAFTQNLLGAIHHG